MFPSDIYIKNKKDAYKMFKQLNINGYRYRKGNLTITDVFRWFDILDEHEFLYIKYDNKTKLCTYWRQDVQNALENHEYDIAEELMATYY